MTTPEASHMFNGDNLGSGIDDELQPTKDIEETLQLLNPCFDGIEVILDRYFQDTLRSLDF